MWRRVVDWALIGAAVGAVLWLTVTAWASLTWFVIGLVIYELLLPLVNHWRAQCHAGSPRRSGCCWCSAWSSLAWPCSRRR